MARIAWTQIIPKQLTIGVVGMKRQGKTYWMAHSAFPKLVHHGIPFLAVDCVGGLARFAEENKTAFVVICGDQDLPGSPTWLNLLRVIEQTWKKKQGLVLEIGGMLQENKAAFMDALSRYIWKRKQFFRKGVIVVDEVHEVVPQDRGRYAPEFERLLRAGGNHELAFIISTQRPATVNKNLWYLTDILVVFRQTYEPDVRPILDVIKRSRTTEETNQLISKIAGLGVGEHIIVKWTKF